VPAKKAAAKTAGAKTTKAKGAKAKTPNPNSVEERRKTAGPTTTATGIRVPTPQEVKDLVRRADVQSKQASEAAGAVGEMIAKAVESKHFNRKALSVVRSFNSMSDNKLAEALPAFLYYCDCLGLKERAEKQGKLDLDTKAASADGEGDDDNEQIDAPVLQPMETAGEDMNEEVVRH
jgi:hypothetical protein